MAYTRNQEQYISDTSPMVDALKRHLRTVENLLKNATQWHLINYYAEEKKHYTEQLQLLIKKRRRVQEDLVTTDFVLSRYISAFQKAGKRRGQSDELVPKKKSKRSTPANFSPTSSDVDDVDQNVINHAATLPIGESDAGHVVDKNADVVIHAATLASEVILVKDAKTEI